MEKLFRFLVVLLLFSMFCACEKEIDKYYERPDWLRGNAKEYLESQGNFTLFLEAVQRVGYEGTLNGREICTVMAPNDEAFKKYLSKNSYASIEDIPVESLKVLVAYHIVKQAYEKEYMLEYIMDPSDGKPSSGEANAFRFETKAQLMYRETVDPLTGNKIKILPENKYLPVISSRLFPKLELENPEENYKFFFPEVTWLGTDEQLYAQNAAVLEAGIATDNGYVYVLDAVCEPLRTVYEALENPKEGDFSIFLGLYNKFSEVFYSSKNAIGDSLFTFDHYHMKHGSASNKITRGRGLSVPDELPSLASEWSYHSERSGQRADYFMRMTYNYNTFAPTNDALNSYFRDFFEGFSSIQDVPQLTLYYMLQPIACEEENIILPEMFEKEGKKGIYGEKWAITKANVVNSEFCANGILYGLNTVLEPILFHLVTKPMFSTPNFSIMANIFYKADEFVTLTDDTPGRYTLLIVADTTLSGDEYNMSMEYGSDYFNDNKEVVKVNMEAMSAANMLSFGDRHIFNETIDLDEHPDGGIQRVFLGARDPYTYIYTGKNSATNQNCFYDGNGNILNVLNKWDVQQGITNGITYQIDKTVSAPKQTVAQQLSNSYSRFLSLLRDAGLAKVSDKGDVELTVVGEERAIIFALSDDVLTQPVYDELLAMDQDKLQELLNFYFISVDANTLSDYILPHFETCDGTYSTMSKDSELSTIYKTEYHKLTVKAVGNKLEVSNAKGDVVSTDGEAPLFGSNGIVYGLTGLIKNLK